MPSSLSTALLLASIALAIAGLSLVFVGVICTVAVWIECYIFYKAGT